jgi:hypothetical protein
MNSWTTTKKTFYSLYVKFVNQNLIQGHKIPVKFFSPKLTHDQNVCYLFKPTEHMVMVKIALKQIMEHDNS